MILSVSPRFRDSRSQPVPFSQLLQGETLSDDELQAMIDEFDKNHDGVIDENEFMAIMKQTSIY